MTHDVFIFKNNFYYFIGLKDGPVLLLWFVIFVRVYWGTTTTITISNHNIGILAPFRFPDPTSFQCFQSGNLGRYQNTKLPVIMIFQILVFFCARFLASWIITHPDATNVHVWGWFRLSGLSVALIYSISRDVLCECDREILAVMNKNSLRAALKVRRKTELVEFKSHRLRSRSWIVSASKYLRLFYM